MRGRKQTKMWTMKNGEKIRICDMDDNHLANTIWMLRRYKSAIVSQMYIIAGTLQGEMAQDCIDRDIMSMEEEDIEEVHDLGENLLLDAYRRELEI